MQIVAKHSGAVSSLSVTRATGRLVSSGDDGTIYVYGNRGHSVASRLRNAHGCFDLSLCDGGERLVYVTRDGWVEHRSVSTGFKYPIKGTKRPRADYGERDAECKYIQSFGRFYPGRVAIVKQYDWKQSAMTQPQGPERIKPSCLELYRWGRGRRSRNDLVRFGNIVNMSAEKLTAGCWTENFFAGAWGNTIGTHDGYDRPSNYEQIDQGWFRRFSLEAHVRCMTAGDGDTVWGGTEDGRLFRVNLESEALVEPRYYRIPETPIIECVAVSPCGRYLAVGVDYDLYGAILVYSGQEVRPVLMIDCGRSASHLVWRHERFQEAPDGDDSDEALTLFSGHGNGNVCKWYVARQLRWQGLMDERPRTPAQRGEVERVADLVEENLGRAIDV